MAAKLYKQGHSCHHSLASFYAMWFCHFTVTSSMSLSAADGSRFQEMLQDPSLASFFQEPCNLLFAICIDGRNPYNSGTYSLTPMLLQPMLLQHLGLPAHVSIPQYTSFQAGPVGQLSYSAVLCMWHTEVFCGKQMCAVYICPCSDYDICSPCRSVASNAT